MNNFFNNIFKKINTTSENKAKEEEDVIKETNLNFEIISNKNSEDYDKYIMGMKIDDVTIEK
jgi:hypothetical protein